jgi:hypothetical protein
VGEEDRFAGKRSIKAWMNKSIAVKIRLEQLIPCPAAAVNSARRKENVAHSATQNVGKEVAPLKPIQRMTKVLFCPGVF